MALFHSSVPVSHDSVTVSQRAQYQDPETEATKWNSAVINFIIYTCAFPAVTCQNVFLEKGFCCAVSPLVAWQPHSEVKTVGSHCTWLMFTQKCS